MLSERGVRDKWAEEAQNLQFESAAKIKAAADGWTSYISSFLGVLGFASVAFVPSALKDLAEDARWPITLLSLGVVGCGLMALIYAAQAARVVPKFLWADGVSYRAASYKAAEAGARQLNLSRRWTAGALTCLLVAAAVAVLVRDPVPARVMLVYRTGQPVLCGKPKTNTAGQVTTLLVGKNYATPVKLAAVISMQDISNCP